MSVEGETPPEGRSDTGVDLDFDAKTELAPRADEPAKTEVVARTEVVAKTELAARTEMADTTGFAEPTAFAPRTAVAGPPGQVTEIPQSRMQHHNALPMGTKLGEFEIIDLVGEGGFGIVYLAQDHSLHRKVALKEYMPSQLALRGQDASVSVRSERNRATFDIGLRSFVNEARMLAQFDHPALVKVYRFWEANGTAYMVMPFFSGKTLQDVLKERGEPPDEAWIRKILWPVMEALEIIHGDQVYHRDIAPDNIMLLADDRPVLLDFGAARRVITDMTQALTVILKPGYAPIEQYADMPGMKQGPWTDVYALAAVVYFMILRRKPPPAVSRMMQDSFEPLMLSDAAARYSQRLLFGIDRCLSIRSEGRPQSIAEMRSLLEQGAEQPPRTASIESLTPTEVISPPARLPARNEARVPTVAPAPPVAGMRAAPRGSTDIELDIDDPSVPADVDIFSDVKAPTPAPAARSKTPVIAGVSVAVIALAAVGGWFATRPSPVAPPPVVAAAPAPKPAPSAPVATPPAAARFATLAAGIDGALAASDARFALAVDAPASVPAGGELKLSVRSKAEGFAYFFAWDQAADRVVRLAPEGSPIKADATLAASALKDGVARTGKDAPAGWRVLALVSERPRDLAATPFAREGDAMVADRAALDAQLAAKGLPALFGTPQCAASQPCADRYAVAVANVARDAAAAAAANNGKKPPPDKKADKKPGAEREYMKRFDQDLDKLLGK